LGFKAPGQPAELVADHEAQRRIDSLIAVYLVLGLYLTPGFYLYHLKNNFSC
jgi:hypothetical protein